MARAMMEEERRRYLNIIMILSELNTSSSWRYVKYCSSPASLLDPTLQGDQQNFKNKKYFVMNIESLFVLGTTQIPESIV